MSNAVNHERLYCLGSNGAGQLGLGHEEDAYSPQAATLPTQTHGIVQIAAGGNHTLLLTENGKVYASGCNDNGRCFLPTSIESSNTFQESNLDGHITHIAATWEASFVVIDSQQILCSGTGRKGELGLGSSITVAIQPQAFSDFPPPGTTIVTICGSMSHVVVVLSNGEVYGWGVGRKGQLGDANTDCWTPRKIEGLGFDATKAVCGKDFTLVVGTSQSGQFCVIGSDKWGARTKTPPNVTRWKDIGAGWSSICILMENGQIISWGRNDHKQLHPITLPKLKSIAVGSEHAICLTEDGKTITWGWGEHGNCGPLLESGALDFDETLIVFDDPIRFVGAGCATSFIICS